MQPLSLNRISVNFLSLEKTIDRYVETMSFWCDMRRMIDDSSWIEVRYEDIVHDLKGQLQRTLAHFDLPWHDDVEQFQSHAKGKYVHSPSYEAVTKDLHSESIGRWRNYADALEPFLERLEPFCEQWGFE